MSRKKSGSTLAKAGTYIFPLVGLVIGAGIIFLSMQKSIKAELEDASMAETNARRGADGSSGYETLSAKDDPGVAEATSSLGSFVDYGSLDSIAPTSGNEASFMPAFPIELVAPERPLIEGVDPDANKEDPDKKEEPVKVDKTWTLLSAESLQAKPSSDGRAIHLFWDNPVAGEGVNAADQTSWLVMRAKASSAGKAGDFSVISVLESTKTSYVDLMAPSETKFVYAIAQGRDNNIGGKLSGAVGSTTATVGDQEVSFAHGALAQSTVVDPMFGTESLTWFVTSYDANSSSIKIVSFLWLEIPFEGASHWIRFSAKQEVQQAGFIGEEINATKEGFKTAKVIVERNTEANAFEAVDIFADDDFAKAVRGVLDVSGKLSLESGYKLQYIEEANKEAYFICYHTEDRKNKRFKSEDKVRKAEDIKVVAPVRDVKAPAEGEGDKPEDGEKAPEDGDKKPAEGDEKSSD